MSDPDASWERAVAVARESRRPDPDAPYDLAVEAHPAELNPITFDVYDGWRVCDACGVSWKASLEGGRFMRQWRAHLADHKTQNLH